jgi:hypothetical protein
MDSETAKEAAEIASSAVEGLANGFSQAPPETTVTYAQMTRMLYEAATRIRNEGQAAIEASEK